MSLVQILLIIGLSAGAPILARSEAQSLVGLTLSDGKVIREDRYLGELGERIRDVQQGTEGALYLLTDSGDGRVLRVRPEAP